MRSSRVGEGAGGVFIEPLEAAFEGVQLAGEGFDALCADGVSIHAQMQRGSEQAYLGHDVVAPQGTGSLDVKVEARRPGIVIELVVRLWATLVLCTLL